MAEPTVVITSTTVPREDLGHGEPILTTTVGWPAPHGAAASLTEPSAFSTSLLESHELLSRLAEGLI